MMESKRSKKTKSDGGSSRSSNSARTSLISTSTTRPFHKERVQSAPLLSQQQFSLAIKSQTPTKRASHNSESGSGSLTTPSSPVDRKSGHSSKTFSTQSQVPGSEDINEVVIAVLGGDAVGKSTFVHLALDLKKMTTSTIASKKVSLEGLISMVRLVKVNIDEVDIEDESLKWPENIGEQKIPSIDGALVMYNVLDPSSIATVPPVLSESFLTNFDLDTYAV